MSRPIEIAIVGKRDDPATCDLLRAVLGQYLPNRTLAVISPGETIGYTLPILVNRAEQIGKPTAYVCEGYTCNQPVDNPESLTEQLKSLV